MHHIATDGWSLGPLVRDLATAYTAYTARTGAGAAPDGEPLPVQYTDHTLWQHELPGDADDPQSPLAQQLAYRRTTLARRLGYRADEERISLEQWRAECASGTITEVFACGTAAVITPAGRVRDRDGDWTIGEARPATSPWRCARA
ncbi:hypothetical protein ACFUJY_34065 [Streptomyces sp. NPDC057249]|uniref:hypothetical protein n=1 Tax=Streptomyces sp. NPDC057249 TaxID=3346067 RepID=UPI00363A607F